QERLGAALMRQLYSPELDFPHLSMLAESTLRGLDVVAERGFIDLDRVAIAGVSHGSFVPMYILQQHDRIAAISISGPGWSLQDYYAMTGWTRAYEARRSPAGRSEEWMPDPERDPAGFWSRIDLADHVDAI